MVTNEWLELLANGKRDILAAAGTVRLELLKDTMSDPTSSTTWADIAASVADYPTYTSVVFDPAEFEDAVLVDDEWRSRGPACDFEQLDASETPCNVLWIAFVLTDTTGDDPVERLLHLTKIDPGPKVFADIGDKLTVRHYLVSEACTDDDDDDGSGDDFTVRSPDGEEYRTPDGDAYRTP